MPYVFFTILFNEMYWEVIRIQNYKTHLFLYISPRREFLHCTTGLGREEAVHKT